jgi:ABC-type polysaccharide/polyol phosphate transport system ATPase subunit
MNDQSPLQIEPFGEHRQLLSQETFLLAESLGVSFPVRGNIREQGLSESDDRLIWNKHGKLRAVQALRNISLDLKTGDRLAIVGRNGSGKTTLLQVLGGILSPSAGRLTYRGRVTSLININLGIQPEASGHRNITLRGLASGYSRKEIEQKRGEIAEFSELGEFLSMPMMSYSAGMRMRLTFAIATAFTPEILVLDEWLSAGDTAFKKKATNRMQEFVGKAGILILASHSRQLILDNCEQAIWLDGGEIRERGPVEEVLKAYESDSAPSPKTPEAHPFSTVKA